MVGTSGLHSFDKIFTKIKNIVYTRLTTSLTPSPTFTTTSHHHERLNLRTPLQPRKCITSSHRTYLSKHREGPAPRRQEVWIRSWLGYRYLVRFILFATKSRSYLAVMAYTRPVALECIPQFSVLTENHAKHLHRAGVLTYSLMAPSNIFSIPRVSFTMTKWFWLTVSTFFSLLFWILDLDLY